jgi:hypothetical protein
MEREVAKGKDRCQRTGRLLRRETFTNRSVLFSNRSVLLATALSFSKPLLFVIPRVCNFIGFEKKLTLKTKGLDASKVGKNQ